MVKLCKISSQDRFYLNQRTPPTKQKLCLKFRSNTATDVSTHSKLCHYGENYEIKRG